MTEYNLMLNIITMVAAICNLAFTMISIRKK